MKQVPGTGEIVEGNLKTEELIFFLSKSGKIPSKLFTKTWNFLTPRKTCVIIFRTKCSMYNYFIKLNNNDKLLSL